MNRPKAVIFPICTVGDDVLRVKTSAVNAFNKKLSDLVKNMSATMYHANGIGIAAPQVGKNLAVCVVDVSPCTEEDETCILDGKEIDISQISPIAFINPKIVEKSLETSICEEGCLSVPDFRGEVERPETIWIEFVDTKNKPHKLRCSGIFARCSQHEIDHLNGILFIDKMRQTD